VSNKHTRIAFVTAAYAGIRSDRPIEYYHRPLNDFLGRYRQTGGEALLLIHANEESWSLIPEFRKHIDIAIVDEPEDHVWNIWPDEDWSATYQCLLQSNPTHCQSYQARFKRLIAVYLCKLRLVEIAFESNDCDLVLWHDSGHWVSHGAQHDLQRYDDHQGPKEANGRSLDRLLRLHADRFPVFGTLSRPNRKRFHMPLAWMRRHAVRVRGEETDLLLRSLYTAVLWSFRRDAFPEFIAEFRDAWRSLIEMRQAGIEENALTIAAWRRSIPGLDYADWRRLLTGSQTDVNFVSPGQREVTE